MARQFVRKMNVAIIAVLAISLSLESCTSNSGTGIDKCGDACAVTTTNFPSNHSSIISGTSDPSDQASGTAEGTTSGILTTEAPSGWISSTTTVGAIAGSSVTSALRSSVAPQVQPSVLASTSSVPSLTAGPTLPPVPAPVVTGSSDSISLFIWCSTPSIGNTMADWQGYYTTLLDFVQSNAIEARIFRLLIRVMSPNFPGNNDPIWWPPQTSPLYTNLIAKLPPGVELIMSPYVLGSSQWSDWSAFSTSGDVLDGIYSFTAQWNTYLQSVGSSNLFVGTSYDMEEFVGMPSAFLTATTVSNIKQKYTGISKIGVALGFDETTVLAQMASYIDHFYMEMYDFYTPTSGITDSPQSPFLVYQDNPEGLINYIQTYVMTKAINETYSQYATQVYPMWSDEATDASCLYPKNGSCGSSHLFGSWSPTGFTNFILDLDAQSSIYASIGGHGLYHFTNIPTSWAR